MIGIIDYGSGNIQAIQNIYEAKQIPFIISKEPKDLSVADGFILAGVGSFDVTMKLLRSKGWLEFLNQSVLVDKKPVLGICVGMQVMGDYSEEGSEAGLGWIPGSVKKMAVPADIRPSLPHLGWNEVSIKKETEFLSIKNNSYFYFLHSYYFETSDPHNIWLTSEYHGEFASGINKGNIYGVQFHPEKSHDSGVDLLCSFARSVLC